MSRYCDLSPEFPLTDMDRYWDYQNQPSSVGLYYLSQPVPLFNNQISITYPPPACPFTPCHGVRRCPTITNYFSPVGYVRGSYN